MNNNLLKRIMDKKEYIFFPIILILIVVQFSALGMKYFPIADDNNQLGIYHVLSQENSVFENIINRYKNYNVRPLALITDVYFFQWFAGNNGIFGLYFVLVLMLLLHIANIFFLYKIGEKVGIKIGTLSMIIMAFYPLLIEGLYWISASTRIVVSLFFSLASLYTLLISFNEDNKKKRTVFKVLSLILNLICVGYYEQTIALNVFLFAFVLILLKKYKYIFIPIISTFWIGLWYVYFSIHGEMQSRGELSLSIKTILPKISQALDDVKVIFNRSIGEYISAIGRGTSILLQSPLTLIFILVILGIGFFFICTNKISKEEDNKKEKIIFSILKKLGLSIVLIVAPMLPFAVLASSYTANRNLYLPLFGIAVLIELVVDLVLLLVKNNNAKKILKECLVGFLLTTFVFANIDGLSNYYRVSKLDDEIAESFIQALPSEAFEEGKILVINYDYDEMQSAKSVSNLLECSAEADWLFAGKMGVKRKVAGGFCKVYINPTEEIDADYEVELKFLPEVKVNVM